MLHNFFLGRTSKAIHGIVQAVFSNALVNSQFASHRVVDTKGTSFRTASFDHWIQVLLDVPASNQTRNGRLVSFVKADSSLPWFRPV